MKTLQDFRVEGKRVLVRCDFNVPLSETGEILDDFRITQTLPTIEYLIAKQAKIIAMSHGGDPGGKVVPQLSLARVQERLLEYLDCSVTLAPDCVGKEIEQWTLQMQNSEILLLENLRFHREEEENEKTFANALAALGDIFINDAFSVSHRAHASIVGVPDFLPAGIGLLMQKELKALREFSQNPLHPFVTIVGGAKAQDKLSFITAISKKADVVLLGNLIAKEAAKQNIVFQNKEKVVFPVDGVPSFQTPYDIGPGTRRIFKKYVSSAKNVFWTGPLGWVERKEYTEGSLEIAKAIVESKAFAVAGGGNLSEFLQEYGLRDKFSYVSAGGGATLAFLGGELLPGLAVLQ